MEALAPTPIYRLDFPRLAKDPANLLLARHVAWQPDCDILRSIHQLKPVVRIEPLKRLEMESHPLQICAIHFSFAEGLIG